jgi:hypothetical protein
MSAALSIPRISAAPKTTVALNKNTFVAIDPDRVAVTFCLVAFAVNLLVAAILVFHFRLITRDAISQVLAAYYLEIRRFSLAQRMLVANPLIPIIEIPFVWLGRIIWPALINDAFAANFLSAGFGAVGTYYLARLINQIGIPRPVRWLVIVFYILNPAVLLINVTGSASSLTLAATWAVGFYLSRALTRRHSSDYIGALVWYGVVALVNTFATSFLAAAIVVCLLLTRTRNGALRFVDVSPLFRLMGGILVGGLMVLLIYYSDARLRHIVTWTSREFFLITVASVALLTVELSRNRILLLCWALACLACGLVLSSNATLIAVSVIFGILFLTQLGVMWFPLLWNVTRVDTAIICTVLAVIAGLGGNLSTVNAMTLPKGRQNIAVLVRTMEDGSTPILIIGGSAADGWHDSSGQGYVQRALRIFGMDSHIPEVTLQHAIPGSPMTNPHIAAQYPSWLRSTPGGVVILAWGLLNDIRLHISIRKDYLTLHREMALALATGHMVILVSPPLTVPGDITHRVAELRLWRMEVVAASSFHSPDVHVINVFRPELIYIEQHRQDVEQYMSGSSWDPNTAGHILAAKFLIEGLRRIPDFQQQLMLGLSKAFVDATYDTRYILDHSQYGYWFTGVDSRDVTRIAQFINNHPHWIFLMDSNSYWGVIPRVQHLKQLIMPGDGRFKRDLLHPQGAVTAIVVPEPSIVGGKDAVDIAYPTLYTKGLMWARPIMKFGYTKIYLVSPKARGRLGRNTR